MERLASGAGAVLYEPSAHEALIAGAWDEGRIRHGISSLVADAVAAADPQALWPAHEWDAWTAAPPISNLYVGAAGVIWALDKLRHDGHADVPLDLGTLALRALERWREQPEYETWPVPVPDHAAVGLFLGETGPLLVAWQLTGMRALAEALLQRVRESLDSDANELFWGVPGTLLAAHAVGGEDEVRMCVDAILSRRDSEGLWAVHVDGRQVQSLTASHGFAGIVHALRRAGVSVENAGAVAARHAIVEDGLANWPVRPGRPLRASDGEIRVQWDAGAPGVVASLAHELDEELAVAAGELLWHAGPLRKGPMLCHGTAGNGFAFLALFERTGDELWLERARRFAMHALAQVQALPPRYSLWTGGVGVALFLARCLDADARVPILDDL